MDVRSPAMVLLLRIISSQCGVGQVEPAASPERRGFQSDAVRARAYALDLTYGKLAASKAIEREDGF